jgi:hypothetical protein
MQGSHDAGRISSSFDEPLSSAMTSVGYPSSPPVIPMSFKNSIPTQRAAAGLSDGMTKGFARVRREIGRVRSPRLTAQHDVTAKYIGVWGRGWRLCFVLSRRWCFCIGIHTLVRPS